MSLSINPPHEEYSDPSCPECGSDDIEWVTCWACYGEGGDDEAEYDPVNFAPGEEWNECEECNGAGGYLVRHHGCATGKEG